MITSYGKQAPYAMFKTNTTTLQEQIMFSKKAALLTVLIVISSFGLTLDDIIARTSGKSDKISIPYRVSIETVISFGSNTMKDSGYVEFSPPDCYHIVTSNGRIDQSSCGDTTWISRADGSITRKIGNNAMAQFQNPDIAQLLKKQNARVIADSGKTVVMEMSLKENGISAKAQFTIDTTYWLVRESLIIPEAGVPVESGYAYTTFHGHQVLSRINTVMRNGGFVKISFSDYTKIRKIPRAKFRKM